MSKKKILVEIKCQQVLVFKQQKQMTVEEYEKLRILHGDEVTQATNPEEYSLLEAYINPHDVYDAHNEYTDFEITKLTGK